MPHREPPGAGGRGALLRVEEPLVGAERAFTTLPSAPQAVEAITDPRDLVAGFGLAQGTARSLDAKLGSALDAAQAGDTAGACASLGDFLNEVRAQTGKKKLTAAQAEQLTGAANDIRTQLGC